MINHMIADELKRLVQNRHGAYGINGAKLECGSLLPLLPHRARWLGRLFAAKIPASKLAGRTSGSELPHYKSITAEAVYNGKY